MIYKLNLIDAGKLISMPETRMGYQIVEARRYTKPDVHQFLVLNSELVLDFDNDPWQEKSSLRNFGYRKIISEAELIYFETASIKILNKTEIRKTGVRLEKEVNDKGRHSGGTGAKENKKENANGSESFVRISAYEDDKRIDFQSKRLKPGSYTITFADYIVCVRTSDDPIDRYSLPNDEPIRWSFYIKPLTKDVLQRGIVQPDFGHKGGGLEAFFENGTSEGTFFDKKEYGK